jgi:hypothetical protein
MADVSHNGLHKIDGLMRMMADATLLRGCVQPQGTLRVSIVRGLPPPDSSER